MVNNEALITKDTLLVFLLFLGGGTILKLLGLQTYFTLIVLAVSIFFTRTEHFEAKEIFKVLLILVVLTAFQFIHTISDLTYEFFTTQYLRSLVDVVLGYLVAKYFQQRQLSFIKNIHLVLFVFIVHAILSVLVLKIFGGGKILFVSPDDGALLRGPNPLFAVRSSTDVNGYPINPNVLGMGLERAHGIFWEPSVFVNYVGLFLYVNLFLRFNLTSTIIGLVAVILAWSSTGFLLLSILVLSFIFYPNKSAQGAFRSRLRRVRLMTSVLILPLVILTMAWNISSFFSDNRKLGSVSQRFYDTFGAVISISDHPLLGSGVNLESYSSSLADSDKEGSLRTLSGNLDLNSKAQVKFSNSFLRIFVKYGIPFGTIVVFGLYGQKLVNSQTKTVLFALIVVGTSFSPILELMFFMPFIFSGLILDTSKI